MNYHDIKHNDMLNGDGLRVVLFISGCKHACVGCHNEETWSVYSGSKFDEFAKQEIYNQLEEDHISGITLSGGDPLHDNNLIDVYALVSDIRLKFPSKTIWIYTGHIWEDLIQPFQHTLIRKILDLTDVIIDGRFIQDLADINYPWGGSSNQRSVDVKKSLKLDKVVLWDN